MKYFPLPDCKITHLSVNTVNTVNIPTLNYQGRAFDIK